MAISEWPWRLGLRFIFLAVSGALTYKVAAGIISALIILSAILKPLADARKNQFKTTYLYQISRFVTWPDNYRQATRFTFCLYQADEFQETLRAAQGRKIEGRPFLVEVLTNLEFVEHCQILFVRPFIAASAPVDEGQNETPNDLASNPVEIGRNFDSADLKQILSQVSGKPVLLISDSLEFAKNGGTIELINKSDGSIAFNINRESARRAQLEISSNLLELAKYLYPLNQTLVTQKQLNQELQ